MRDYLFAISAQIICKFVASMCCMTSYVTVITEFSIVKVSLTCSRSLMFSSSISFISRARLVSISILVVVSTIISISTSTFIPVLIP